MNEQGTSQSKSFYVAALNGSNVNHIMVFYFLTSVLYNEREPC